VICNELVHSTLFVWLKDTPCVAQGECLGLMPRGQAAGPSTLPQLAQSGLIHQTKASKSNLEGKKEPRGRLGLLLLPILSSKPFVEHHFAPV